MEDSPSPQKAAETKRLKEKRRVSVPAPTAFRPSASAVARATSPSLSTGPMATMAASTGIRRPQSRMSGGGTSSSITSRPQTPTFLPLPSSSLYGANSSTIGMKRSIGPGASNPYGQFKRSSIARVLPCPYLLYQPAFAMDQPPSHPFNDQQVRSRLRRLKREKRSLQLRTICAPMSRSGLIRGCHLQGLLRQDITSF